MSKVQLQEIIIASNEKSIITGTAGFGIRTVSENMSHELASKIFQDVKTIYDLPVSRQVLAKQLREDPTIVCRYPRTYRQQIFESEGKKYYIVSCATYVGIDYGFFSGNENARRAGTNYLSDVLVSEEPMSAALWMLAAKGSLFHPADNTCVPDNAEMKHWLTGNPEVLPTREVELPTDAELSALLTPQSASLYSALLRALLQAKMNRDVKAGDMLCRLMVLAPDAKMPELLTAMAMLPDEIAAGIKFESNYLSGHGMPSECNMVVINEHNTEETYQESYLLLDINGEQPKLERVSKNAILNAIDKLIVEGNLTEANKMASYLYAATVTPSTEYEVLLKMYVMTETELPFEYKEIDATLIDKIEAFKLDDAKMARLKTVIISKMNSSLLASQDNPKEVLDVIVPLWKAKKDYFVITAENTEWLTVLLLSKKQLASMISVYGMEFTAYCLTPNYDKSAMLEALELCDNAAAWQYFVDKTFGSTLPELFNTILNNILAAKIQNKEQLINDLFPMDSYERDYTTLFMNQPSWVPVMPASFAKLCSQSKEYMLNVAQLHDAQQPSNELVNKALNLHASQCVANGIDTGLDMLIEYGDVLSDQRIAKLNPTLYKTIFDNLMAQKVKVSLKRLDDILEIKQFERYHKDIEHLKLMKTENEDAGRLEPISLDDMILAVDLGKTRDFRDQMFCLWLSTTPRPDNIKQYLQKVNVKKDAEWHGKLIMMVWGKRKDLGSRAEEYINAIVDVAKWSDKEKLAFARGADAELKSFFYGKLSWWRRMLDCISKVLAGMKKKIQKSKIKGTKKG